MSFYKDRERLLKQLLALVYAQGFEAGTEIDIHITGSAIKEMALKNAEQVMLEYNSVIKILTP
jgi:hypothetical protein